MFSWSDENEVLTTQSLLPQTIVRYLSACWRPDHVFGVGETGDFRFDKQADRNEYCHTRTGVARGVRAAPGGTC